MITPCVLKAKWARPQYTSIQVRCDTWDSNFCMKIVVYFSKNQNYLFHFLLTGSADHITVPARGFRALDELNPNRWTLNGQLILCLLKNLASDVLCWGDKTANSRWSSASFSKTTMVRSVSRYECYRLHDNWTFAFHRVINKGWSPLAAVY